MEHNFGTNVHIMHNPLLTHKISLLRDKHTGTNEFRQLVEEIAMLMGFEALSDLPTKTVELETPIETANVEMLAGRKLAIVPILRAGLGMVSVFCGVTNSPLTSLLLAYELFGGDSLALFALPVTVAYMLSGYYGLYSEQKILYSKLKPRFIDRKTK